MPIVRYLLVAILLTLVHTSVVTARDAPSERTRVDLALILMLDASASVTTPRWNVQQRSYAAAFRDEHIVRAITSGAHGSIAVLMMHWAGPEQQRVVIPWTIVESREASYKLADTMAKTNRSIAHGETFIGDALAHATAMFDDMRFIPERKVIDISGDGQDTNHGVHPQQRGYPLSIARARAIQKGITINGLPILGDEPHVAAFYEEFVIGGLGAFVVVVRDPLDEARFVSALRMKLVREIALFR